MSTSFKNFENSIPEEIFKISENIYKSMYCTHDYILKYLKKDKINAFVIYENKNPIHTIFYDFYKNSVAIINQFFYIEKYYLDYFSSFIFKSYKSINYIHINKISHEISGCKYPFIEWGKSYDIIIDLPDSEEKYLEKLGKKTKKTIRYNKNKINKEFNSHDFSIQVRNDIDSQVVRKISKLNRQRMETLKIKSVIDADFEQNTIEFAKKYGVVGFLTLNERIVAGAVCYEIGDHSYGEVIAFDQNFDNYRAGLICAYSIILVLIKRGSRVFHMGIGDSDYKFRLAGTKDPVYRFSIFRSELHKYFGLIRNLGKFDYVIRGRNFIKYQILQKIQYTCKRP